MKVAVAGGTGSVGRKVVDAARAAGHEVEVLTRGTGVDLLTGAGLEGRLAGVDVVIDVSNSTAMSAEKSRTFFTTVTATLLSAEQAADVGHHVALSIVGVDRSPLGYYAGKRAQELAVEAGPVPWTILRATQFHEFVAQAYGMAKLGPLRLAPRMRTQPVAASEVAARLCQLAEGEPLNAVVELAGPREESLVEMIRSYARANGSNAWIPAVSIPGAFGRAQRDGSLLPGPEAQRGVQTFADWVSTRA